MLVFDLKNAQAIILPDCIRLRGEVYGHPRFEDGQTIITSPVQSVRVDSPDLVHTRNSLYLLEVPFADLAVHHKESIYA